MMMRLTLAVIVASRRKKMKSDVRGLSTWHPVIRSGALLEIDRFRDIVVLDTLCLTPRPERCRNVPKRLVVSIVFALPEGEVFAQHFLRSMSVNSRIMPCTAFCRNLS